MREHSSDPWMRLLGFFHDPEVDEVLVNGERSAMVIRGGIASLESSPFDAGYSLVKWLIHFARSEGVRLDPLCGSAGGMVGPARLVSICDGHIQVRWHALLPPLSQDGPLLALRRHRLGHLSIADFGGEDEVKERLLLAVSQRRSILIAGPTGSGKTTLMVALLAASAARERVVILESVAEIPALYPSWIRLLERMPNLEGVGAVSIERLLQESLRLRPDRLVLGEMRGHEARPFISALMSGHDGGMGTIHAGSLSEAQKRLKSLAFGWHLGAEDAVGRRHNLPDTNLDMVLMKRGERPVIAAFETGKI